MVLGAGDEQALCRVPVDGFGVPAVALELGLHGAEGKVKDLEGGIVRGGDKLGVVGAEGEVADGVRVGVDALDVVEVGLPVLDEAVVVARDEPVVAVGVLEGADGRVVRLHDGLKVEARAVPEGELAARRRRQQAAALGRPSHHVDGVLDLVEGGVQVFGGNGVGRVSWAGHWW